MALITDLPTNASPANADYMITDNGSTTSKSTLRQLKESALGMASNFRADVAQITGNSSVTYTSTQARGLIYTVSADGSAIGVWVFNTQNSGTINVSVLHAATKLSVSTGTNTLTLTSTTSSAVFVEILLVTGSLSL